MKIRTGFVSNSSSSSFIIAIKQSDTCLHCGRSDPDFLALLSSAGDLDGNSSVRARGKEETVRYMLERLQECGIDPAANTDQLKDWERDMLDQYHQLQRFDIEGYDLAAISISYHNRTIDVVFQQSIETNTIKVLQDEN